MSERAQFSIGLHELEDGPKELNAPLPNAWLEKNLQDTDVRPASPRDGEVHLVLTKNGPSVLVQGRLKTTISVPCARTLDPAVYSVEPEVFLMLSPAHPTRMERVPGRDRRAPKPPKPAPSKKHRPQKGSSGWNDDNELSDEEAAEDTYSGDQVVLDHFLREFILLEVPMVPLREDLRNTPFEANPPLPGAPEAASGGRSGSSGHVPRPGEDPPTMSDKPLDPRLSPLAELKAKLEKKE